MLEGTRNYIDDYIKEMKVQKEYYTSELIISSAFVWSQQAVYTNTNWYKVDQEWKEYLRNILHPK